MSQREWRVALDARLTAGENDACAAVLAYVAGRGVEIDQTELNGVLRRGLLLLAAAGDPLRALTVDAPAVAAVARELDAPERRIALDAGLRWLAAEATGLRGVLAELDGLLSDSDLAWRLFASALLAAMLAED